ncbi:MAG TPA: DUF485 domain-containing protein [Thermoanaerobaculia bacterium]|jgi:uncharacterized membrane protein (DUF485 family)|nr:DUF485 domain-containing protein [Thermoanaerobaculia bacterium]
MKSTHEMLLSQEFRTLVRRKWTVSVILTLCLFVVYYGFILLIAVDKTFLARKIGAFTTLGIPLGVAVIVLSWVLTALYVLWANSSHDAAVKHLAEQVKE